jgi:hypothetical protein
MENLIIHVVLMKIKKYITAKISSSEAEIQFKPILGYFLAWFQSLQLPSTPI